MASIDVYKYKTNIYYFSHICIRPTALNTELNTFLVTMRSALDISHVFIFVEYVYFFVKYYIIFFIFHYIYFNTNGIETLMVWSSIIYIYKHTNKTVVSVFWKNRSVRIIV